MRGGVPGQHPYHHQHTVAGGDRKPSDVIIKLWGEPRVIVVQCVVGFVCVQTFLYFPCRLPSARALTFDLTLSLTSRYKFGHAGDM